MSCSEFKKKGYLYFFRELSKPERAIYRKHVKKCPDCREELEKLRATWHVMERAEHERPSPGIRETILEHARRKSARTSVGEKLRSWMGWWETHPSLSLGVSAAAVAVILLFVFVRPFERFRLDRPAQEAGYEWQDDFLAQADWMEQEINRIESGNLLASYYPSEDEYSEFNEDFVSPLSEDLNRIRGEVENLMEAIYGI